MTDYKHWGTRTDGWGAMTAPVGATTDALVAHANVVLVCLLGAFGIDAPAARAAAVEGRAAARARGR